MAEILSSLPQLASLIEKGGVVGLLLIVCAVLGWEVRRLRAENRAVFAQRDRYRLGFALCKAECERNNLKPDLALVSDLLTENSQ